MTNAAMYGKVEVEDEVICRRILTDLLLDNNYQRKSLTTQDNFSLVSSEHVLNKHSDGTDGSHALAADLKPTGGGQGGRGE